MGLKNKSAVANLTKLVSKELMQVNKIILREAKNDVELIPKLAKHLIDAGGKRIRPVLTLASAKLCGYSGKSHINLAAVVEFMHTATLLHDDVVDESELRRGRKTANNIWGNKASVLVGDYLLGRAFQMMTAEKSIPILEILSNAAAKIAEGEVMQLATTSNLKTTEAQYVEVIKAKTAELFKAACEVGGAISGNSTNQNALAEFGENFGIAFQIMDDLLDYDADEKTLGKRVGDDFREGKITLPVIHSYKNTNSKGRKFWQQAVKSGGDFKAAIELIKATDSLEYCKIKVELYTDKAKNSLDGFNNSPLKLALIELLNYNAKRKS